MELPWPPGEETLTRNKCAGVGAVVDVMGLTSILGLGAGKFILRIPLVHTFSMI